MNDPSLKSPKIYTNSGAVNMIIEALMGVVRLRPLKNKSMLNTTPKREAKTTFGTSLQAMFFLFLTKKDKAKNNRVAPNTRTRINA